MSDSEFLVTVIEEREYRQRVQGKSQEAVKDGIWTALEDEDPEDMDPLKLYYSSIQRVKVRPLYDWEK